MEEVQSTVKAPFLEYVASGVSHQLTGISFCSDETIDVVLRMLKTMNTQDGLRYSMLFNAFTEEPVGARLNKYGFRNAMYKLHADSGGLQMVTLGIKAKSKTKIYEAQAKYSDVAMSFDDIPVFVDEGRSSMNSAHNRYFDFSMLKECAIKSANNLKEHVDFFEKIGTESKPFLIMQGNCMESFQIWMDTFVEILGKDRLGRIGGIAFASSSHGNGIYEDFEKCFIVEHMRYPDELKNVPIHFLGLGSPYKFVPYMYRASHFSDKHLSYDATSHTKAVFTGGIVEGWRTVSVGKVSLDSLKNKYDDIYTDLGFPGLIPQDILLKFWRGENLGGMEDKEGKFLFNNMILFASMVETNKSIQEGFQNIDHMEHNLADSNNRKVIIPAGRHFAKLRDSKDFADWSTKYVMLLQSNAVKTDVGKVFEL